MNQTKVVNMGQEFKAFWSQAQNRPFEEQLRIWNEVVEKPYKKFFDEIIWQNPGNPKWEERKNRQLKKYFNLYPKHYSDIVYNFDHFSEVLALQIGRYKKTFPDANFDISIYAAPTATFNGKGGEDPNGSDELGKTVLIFGIDVLTERHDNPDVLYAHELFHIYHIEKTGLNEQVFIKQGKLTLPLWLEGLATYASQVMNPNADLNEVLLDQELSHVSDTDLKWLAKTFLKQANEKAFDEKKPEIYKRWFSVGSDRIRSDIPERSGYLLGLKLAQYLARSHSLNEMVSWNLQRSHQEVLKTLTEISSFP